MSTIRSTKPFKQTQEEQGRDLEIVDKQIGAHVLEPPVTDIIETPETAEQLESPAAAAGGV